MFFYFGKAHKVIKSAHLNGQKCPNCQGTGTHMAVVASYFHLWFIPLISLKKQIQIHCTGCQYVADPMEISDEFDELATSLKSKVRTPFYLHFGAILILLSVGYCTFQSNTVSDEYIQAIENPEVNHIYTLYNEDSDDENKYSLWKVVRLSTDSTYVQANAYLYRVRPHSFASEDGFYPGEIAVHKADLIEMLYAGKIDHIRYELGFGTGFNRTLSMSVEPDQ